MNNSTQLPLCVEPTLDSLLPSVVDLRHQIHAWPEPGFEETKTSAAVAARLEAIPGIKIRKGLAKTGLIADLEGNGDAPLIALRADLDCLPMDDHCGQPWASKRPGFAHACGHDGHTAGLVGAAEILARHRDLLPGPVRFLFQPAEESLGGGKKMVEAGALLDPEVSMIFGLHGNPNLKIGQLGLRSGPVMAASDLMKISIVGKGAHAALPHRGIDPVLAASHLVCALQSMASRRTDPIDNAVVTVGKISGGSTFNIIPDRVELLGTIRSVKEETRNLLHNEIAVMADSLARAFQCHAEVQLERGYPALINHPDAVAHAQRAFREKLGNEIEVLEIDPLMSGEDFAFYGQQIPAAFFFLGICPSDENNPAQWHQSHFDFSDTALPHAMRAWVALAIQPR